MMDFDAESGKNPLENISIEEGFVKEEEKMLFVYDYMNLWTFYLEATSIKIIDGDTFESIIIGKVGDRPANPPEKEMKAESEDDLFSEWDEESEDPDDWY